MQPPTRVRVLRVDPDTGATDRLERADDRFEVTTASDADEALSLLASEGFDCVVAAVDLPDATGVDLLETVREREPTLPFVLVAADGSEALASRAIAAGVTDYVRADEDALADRLADAVERGGTERSGSGRSVEPEGDTSAPTGAAEWDLTPAEYRDVFAKAEVGIGIVDPETGTFEQVNRRWAEMLGYDAHELHGTSIEAISADDPQFDQDAAMGRIRDVLEGSPQQFDWAHERADGTTVWCEVNLKRTRIGGEVRLLAFLRNVAERKERERSLEFLEAMVETVGVGVAAYDADGSFVYVNPRYAEILHTDRETLRDATAWAVTPDLDRESFHEQWATLDVGETRRTETVHEFEGEQVAVETVTTCAEIDGTTYHFGTVRDISERKQQERRFQTFVEQSNDILALIDESGVYRYQSPSVERILGYDPDELVGQSAFEHVHPEDRDRVMAGFRRLVEQSGGDLEVEYRYRHADGSWRWMASRGVNQTSESGIDAYVINSRDVTDRKRYEQGIADLHDATRRMMQANDEATVCEAVVETVERVLDRPIAGVWLRDGSADRLEPVASSQSGRELFGDPPVYTEGNSLSWRAYEAGEPIVVDDMHDKSGLYNPESVVRSELILPLGDHGVLNVASREPDAFSDNDVALAKLLAANAEVALGRSERERKLERQTDRMEFFNSILRHDVLNAVTVIRGRAEFLADDLEGEQRKDAETIVRWSDDVEEIVGRVRTVLETLTGDGDPDLEPVDLGDALRSEVERVRATYSAVTIETDVPASVSVLANDLLGDVLGNVITNAVEHNETEGLRVGVTVEREGETVAVRIADNGQGVDEDRREAIFRRGETGHAKSVGSGFGLFFVDAMVSEYGGEAWVEGNDAGGATFVITLPAADAKTA